MVKFFIVTLFLFLSPEGDEKPYTLLLGPDQKTDVLEPSLFAPGFISDGLPNRDITISPAGDEIYYCVYTPDHQYAAILVTKYVNGKWTSPETASFSKDPGYKFIEPAFNGDGTILYFSSNMPSGRGNEKLNNDIWAVNREGEGWGDPYNIGPPVNTDGGEYFPSFTRDGSMYFTRNDANEVTSYIYRSGYSEGVFHDPVILPDEINCGTDRYNAFVAPDESFVVVPAEGVEKNTYGSSYYIVFKKKDGGWSSPVNMGPQFNTTPGRGWSFSMSPDLKYVFFMATKQKDRSSFNGTLSLDYFKNIMSGPENGFPDIYWLGSGVIDALREQFSD